MLDKEEMKDQKQKLPKLGMLSITCIEDIKSCSEYDPSYWRKEEFNIKMVHIDASLLIDGFIKYKNGDLNYPLLVAKNRLGSYLAVPYSRISSIEFSLE